MSTNRFVAGAGVRASSYIHRSPRITRREGALPDKKIFEPVTKEETITGWIIHAHKGRDRHDEAARTYTSYRYWLGAPTVALSAIVGTSLFVSLQASVNAPGKILLGLVSIVSSVMAGLQASLNFAERAEKHRATGVKYKAMIRELEQFAVESRTHPETADDSLKSIRERLDALELAAPVISPRFFNQN